MRGICSTYVKGSDISMRKICIYGKGGIGKSTTAANVAAAMAESGLKTAVVGCDPKADTTRCLVGRRIPTVLQQLGSSTENNEIAVTGYRGILCIESGGPEPGTGCAGRGIASALREIKREIFLQTGTLCCMMCLAMWCAVALACRCGKVLRMMCIL